MIEYAAMRMFARLPFALIVLLAYLPPMLGGDETPTGAEVPPNPWKAAAPAEVAQIRRAVREHLKKVASLRTPPMFPAPAKVPTWVDCRNEYSVAKGEPKSVAALALRHLSWVDPLLRSEKAADRAAGMAIVHQVATSAEIYLKDPVLVAAVCDGWLLVHLEDAGTNPTKLVNRERLLKMSVAAYVRIKAFEKAVIAGKLLIHHAHNRNQADFARLRIAEAFNGQKKFAEAVAILREIEDPSMQGAKDLISQLAKQAEEQENSKSKSPLRTP